MGMFSYMLFIPQTSVALGDMAVLVEDSIWDTGPKSVRGNWPPLPPVTSRCLQGRPSPDPGFQTQFFSPKYLFDQQRHIFEANTYSSSNDSYF